VARLVERSPFGVMPDGTGVELFTLRDSDLELAVATYGGTVQRLLVPDRAGAPGDVVLGFPGLDQYLEAGSLYLGSIAGRYAGRIAGGSFVLDGDRWTLPANEDGNSLHGGTRGFDKQVWLPVEAGVVDGAATLSLTYVSEDGEMGYPGRLEVAATYRLTGDRSVRLDLRATCDRPTIVNLTSHAYWNLAGEGSGPVDGHLLALRATRYLAVDEELIPTGEIAPVAGTPLDFRAPRRIGEAGAVDLTYVVDPVATLAPAAGLHDPSSGRSLAISTTEPGIHVYSGDKLDGSHAGKAGKPYGARAGVALETQHFPDSPNRDEFPSTVLRPGEELRSSTVWKFGVDLDFGLDSL
jgi:aldose 1-epimerase